MSRARGRPGSDGELGMIMGNIRRTLSLNFIRAQSLCLLSRLCNFGSKAKAAAGRREAAKRANELRRREIMSYYMANFRGRGLNRQGSIFVH